MRTTKHGGWIAPPPDRRRPKHEFDEVAFVLVIIVFGVASITLIAALVKAWV